MPAAQAVLAELPPVAGRLPPGTAVVVGVPEPPSIVVVGAGTVVAGGYASTAAPPIMRVPPVMAKAATIRFIVPLPFRVSTATIAPGSGLSSQIWSGTTWSRCCLETHRAGDSTGSASRPCGSSGRAGASGSSYPAPYPAPYL